MMWKQKKRGVAVTNNKGRLSTVVGILVLVCLTGPEPCDGSLRGQRLMDFVQHGTEETESTEHRWWHRQEEQIQPPPTPTRSPSNKPFVMPARCLEDPDDPQCRELIEIQFPDAMVMNNPNGIWDMKESLREADLGNAYVSRYEDYFVSKYEAYYEPSTFASQEPTMDMCYGNMDSRVYKKWCNSEMPSVSLEPSLQPTVFPGGSNSAGGSQGESNPSPFPSVQQSSSPSPSFRPAIQSPTVLPSVSTSLSPSFSPSLIPSSSLSPSVLPSSSVAPSELPSTSVSPSSCPLPASPSSSVAGFSRLKMHWESSYSWQDSTEEMRWCMICPGRDGGFCQQGDSLIIRRCSADSAYFDFVGSTILEGSYWIRLVGTNLCLERNDTSVTLEDCEGCNELQEWTWSGGDEFEIIQRPVQHGVDFCLTTHHHPKRGETVELYPCRIARKDETSLWTLY